MPDATAIAAESQTEAIDPQAALAAAANDGAGEGGAGEGNADGGELEIIIEGAGQQQDDEPDEARAPNWLRDLRKSNQQKERRIRELETQLQAAKPAPTQIVVGDEPTLEGCGYDGQKFAAEYKAWMHRSQQAEEQRREAERAQKAAGEEWNKKTAAYQAGKSSLRVSDFDAAEAVVTETFTQLQQSILLSGADKPELIVYALGKNPGEARRLAAIKDPVKFAFALSKLEDKVKTTPRKPATQPEQRLPTGGRMAGAAALESNPDKVLEQLRAEAEKTGDLSKVMAYRKQLKEKARAA